MSQTNTNPTALTAEQMKAMTIAKKLYATRMAKINGGLKAKPVILLPRFEEDSNGNWVPIDDNGMRPTKKEGFMYLQFGMPFTKLSASGQMEIDVLVTNSFNDSTKLELLIEGFDLRIGSALPDSTIVVEETVEHPGTTLNGNLKNGWQIKMAGGNSNIACTFTGFREKMNPETGEIVMQMYTNAPIYRRVKVAPIGTTSTLIAHTNTAEISKFASAAWLSLNNPRAGISNSINAAVNQSSKLEELESRLAALKKIKAADRTQEQKDEIDELRDSIDELKNEKTTA